MANKNSTTKSFELSEGKLPTNGNLVSKRGSVDGSVVDIKGSSVWINEIDPYVFMRHADNGTGGFQDGAYLTEHQRERRYEERRNYSYYLNFVKRILNALTNPLFREDPIRTFENKDARYLSLFLEDCDRRGNSLNTFMRHTARKAKRYGQMFVVVDNDATIAPTIADAKEKRQYPYLYSVSPEQVTEYGWDENMNLDRIVFREAGSKSVKTKKTTTTYREIKGNKWSTFSYNESGERVAIDNGEFGIKSFPVVTIYAEDVDEDEDPIMVFPPLYSIARGNLAVYDICSEIRELERNQMFSLLVYPKTAGEKTSSLVTGSGNAIGFPADSSHAPAFISPDPSIMQAVMDDRRFIIEQLFEMASLVGIVGMVVKEESGRAKEIEFQSTREALKEFGNKLEQSERKIFGLFGDYTSQVLGAKIKYSENYGIVDEGAEIERADALLQLNVSPEFNKEVKKKITLIVFRDMEREQLEGLLKDIDDQVSDGKHSNEQDKDQDGV